MASNVDLILKKWHASDKESFFLPLPNDYIALSEHFICLENISSARKVLSAGLRYYPYNEDIYFKKASFLIDANLFEDAFDLLENWESINPNSLDKIFCEISLYKKLQHWQRVIELCESFLSASPKSEEVSLACADAHIELKKPEKACFYLKRVLENDLSNKEVAEQLIQLSLEQNNVDDLLEFFFALSKTNPTDAFVPFYCGLAFLEVGKILSAQEQFNLAITSNPNFEEPYIFLSKCFVSEGKQGEAFNCLYAGVSKCENSTMLRMAIGELSFQDGAYSKAIREFRVILNDDPNYHPALFWIGKCLFEEKKFLQSSYFFKKAFELADVLDYEFAYGKSEHELGNIETALSTLQKLCIKYPKKSSLWLYFSEIFYNEDQLDDAIEVIEDGLSNIPDSSSLLYRKFAYQFAQKKLKESINTLEYALALNYDKHKDVLFFFEGNIELQKAILKLILKINRATN